MNKINKIIVVIALLSISAVLMACTSVNDSEPLPKTFEECEARGGDIAESYPRQCFFYDVSFTEEIAVSEQCELAQGTWLEEPQECEGVSKESCESMGGTFNECASACRNDPDAMVCTMQCVLVCEFAPEEEVVPQEPVIPQNCTSWFDGCNTCMVENGEITGCTRMACAPQDMEEPECLAFTE